MNRDSHGRFSKNRSIQFDLPTLSAILKYAFLILIFSPWLYTIIYKFDLISILETSFDLMFGPKECQTKKEPY